MTSTAVEGEAQKNIINIVTPKHRGYFQKVTLATYISDARTTARKYPTYEQFVVS